MAAGEAAKAPGTSAPKIQFAAPVFDFGKIAAGTVVKHDFVFSNMGGAPLVVTGVHPSCGCTTAGKWTARVEPGQSGTIPIQFRSVGYSGVITKRILVTSNDPDRPKVELAIKGVVRQLIDVSPPNLVFTTVAGASASETKSIRITNHTKAPLVLSAPECGNRAFAVKMQTVRPGREFALRVTTVPPFATRAVVGLITIKTNSSQVPVITITALAVVRKPVTALPTRIWLPAGPLPSSFRTRVTIQNNAGMTGFSVSDPNVNLPGVSAVVKDVRAGRTFDVLLTFPAGLELPPGSRAELTVKTTHPQFPMITVPIHQNRRRTAAPTYRPATGRTPAVPTDGEAAPARAPK